MQAPDSRVLAYGMHSPKVVVSLWPIELDGDLKMKDGITLEYWETCDARQGGVIVDITENGFMA